MTEKKRIPYLLISFFLVLFIVPLAGFLTVEKVSEQENRTLAVFPTYGEHSITEYFSAISDYANDHFGFREQFVALHDKAKSLVAKKVRVRVVDGKDDYMYFIDTIEFYTGKMQQEKERFRDGLRKLRAHVPDAPIIVVVVPSKGYVYPDKLPDWVERSDIREELMGLAQSVDGVEVIDLLKVLKQPAENLYLKYDSHWNGAGAYRGYQYLMKRLQETGYPLSIYEGALSDIVDYEGDLARMAGKKETHKETNIELNFVNSPLQEVAKLYTEAEHNIPDYHNPEGEKTLLLMHDSFAQHGLAKHLAHSFQNIHTMWESSIPQLITAARKAKPDMIMIQIVDRHMMQLKFWRKEDAEKLGLDTHH